MDLQSLFYILAIIIMVLMLAILVGSIIAVFVVKRKVNQQVAEIKSNFFGKTIAAVSQNSRLATLAGMLISSAVASWLHKKSVSKG